MKKIIVRVPGGLEALELIDAPVPAPKANEVLIRVSAMGVSRPDVLIRKGTYSWMPPLPASPGNELTGIVESVGAAVDAIRQGVHVLLSARDLPVRGGCYTQFIAVPEAAVYVLPDYVDLEQAVVIPTYLVAYAMLTDLGARHGARTAYVTGAAGGVGGALVELAKTAGLEVIGSAGSDVRAAHARALGADHIINYQSDPIVEKVMSLTNGRGVDVVFDHIIGNGFTNFLHILADFGTLVFYNVHAPMPDRDVFATMRELSTKSPAVRCFNMHTYDRDPVQRRKLTREVIELVATGKIRPRVGARLPLAQAAEAQRLLESGSVLGKIVLYP